jgi:hypothetical protein
VSEEATSEEPASKRSSLLEERRHISKGGRGLAPPRGFARSLLADEDRFLLQVFFGVNGLLLLDAMAQSLQQRRRRW